jgi:PEGA domain
MISSQRAAMGVRLAVLAISGLSISGCATMTRGTTQSFVVESTPPGASVETTNGFTCVATPCTFKMARKEAFSVTIARPGYVTQTHAIDSKMSSGGGAAMAGNILVGGIIGAGVDASSGALNDLTPNPLIVTLEAEGSAPRR